MTHNATADKPIQIHFESKETLVVVPSDNDRFIMTASKASRACSSYQKQTEQQEAFNEKFAKFLRHIQKWCEASEGLVQRAFLWVSGEGLRVFLTIGGNEVPVRHYESATDLELELDHAFPWCPVEVIAIPNEPDESVTAFFDPASALCLFDRSA